MPQQPATRLYVEAALAEGASVALSPELGASAARGAALEGGRCAWRYSTGATANGWRASRRSIAERGAAVIEHQTRAQPDEAGPFLVFALVKRARLEWLVEKATELGAAALVPALTRRTVAERINPDAARAPSRARRRSRASA